MKYVFISPLKIGQHHFNVLTRTTFAVIYAKSRFFPSVSAQAIETTSP